MRICPKCGGKFDRLLAVSRVDNKTMLCDECGTKEAVEAMKGRLISKEQALEVDEGEAERVKEKDLRKRSAV